MRDVTLVILTKHSAGTITDVCLAMKKRGFGAGRWNGVGGKVTPDESVEDAARREAKEEIGVELGGLQKAAEIDFFFSLNPDWNQKMHAYLCETWNGEPTESEEMRPQWFPVADIPFADMWPDDIFWLPEVLKGKTVTGSFTFGEDDKILEQTINIS